MGKVIIEFDSFEESEEIRLALDGGKWKQTVWEIDQYLRSEIKYANESVSEETINALEKVREELREIINSNNLILE
jgi:hypothetical protein